MTKDNLSILMISFSIIYLKKNLSVEKKGQLKNTACRTPSKERKCCEKCCDKCLSAARKEARCAHRNEEHGIFSYIMRRSPHKHHLTDEIFSPFASPQLRFETIRRVICDTDSDNESDNEGYHESDHESDDEDEIPTRNVLKKKKKILHGRISRTRKPDKKPLKLLYERKTMQPTPLFYNPLRQNDLASDSSTDSIFYVPNPYRDQWRKPF